MVNVITLTRWKWMINLKQFEKEGNTDLSTQTNKSPENIKAAVTQAGKDL